MILLSRMFSVIWIWLFLPSISSNSRRIITEEKESMHLNDEPHIVSWRVLEGVTEPFDSFRPSDIPLWKQMKNAADQKAANMMIQAALHEYGQLLRFWHFGEMPIEEKYDVFLSMSKLLKVMGFHQRAELLLFEAISYTTKPYEAHFQLALLFLDKEDLDKAKVHFKNCLFFRENDIIILSYLSMVLIAEGKLHEAKFFISRVLSGLNTRVQKLSTLLNLGNNEDESVLPHLTSDQTADTVSSQHTRPLSKASDVSTLSRWTEEVFSKVFHGEFRITPSASMDTMSMFSHLYSWLADGEMTGRFVFDLGQSLYEAGRPKIGHMMMQRGFETTDAAAEGIVSTEIVKMRLALDYPVVPDTILEVIEGYLNMTNYLAATARVYTSVELENVMDVYWPLPLLWWSGLPVMPIVSEVMWRFEGGPQRRDVPSQRWLAQPEPMTPGQGLGSGNTHSFPAKSKQPAITSKNSDNDMDIEQGGHGQVDQGPGLGQGLGSGQGYSKYYYNGIASITALWSKPTTPSTTTTTSTRTSTSTHSKASTTSTSVPPPPSHEPPHPHQEKVKIRMTPSKPLGPVPIEVAIMGGHMNNHPAGQMVLHRILGITTELTHIHPTEGIDDWVRITLIALPLVPDIITKQIASKVHRIVNLPMDTTTAWKIIEGLPIDVLLFPDYQPFPDQQSVLFQSRRIAPVQLCFFVRGSSCAATEVDYYLLPSELEHAYLHATPAADSMTTISAPNTATATSATAAATTATTVSAAPDTNNTTTIPSPDSPAVSPKKPLRVRIRPPWLETYSEQVVLLDWPLLVPQVVQAIARGVIQHEAVLLNKKTDHSVSHTATHTESSNSHQQSQHQQQSQQQPPQPSSPSTTHSSDFAPSEVEGQIFFEGQPVALVPLVPMYLHPLMDEILFKILRANPLLQVVLVLPDSFFTHVQDPRYKMNWARKVARRLWSKGGTLYHRIRLLPTPLSDYRLLQLMRLADVVLDTFPVGGPMHTHALALSVGTPVLTMRSGVVLTTPRDDLQEMRVHLQLLLHAQMQQQQSQQPAQSQPQEEESPQPPPKVAVGVGEAAGVKRRLDLNPMFRRLALLGSHDGTFHDIPWNPVMSAIAGYYQRAGVADVLVANSTADYFRIANTLVSDREASYLLRVRLLEAVDNNNNPIHHHNHHHHPSQEQETRHGTGQHLYDLASFIERIGRPWADLRNQQEL